MSTQNDNAASFLSGIAIPAGNYQWARLMDDASKSSITFPGGTVHALATPRGSQTGIKPVSGLRMAPRSHANFTIGFDPRKAVTLSKGIYTLKAALRLISYRQVRPVVGSVNNTYSIGGTSITPATCSPGAYVYSGANVMPVDVNFTSTVQPAATGTLNLNNPTGNYDYTAAFLAPLEYTLVVSSAANGHRTTADALTLSTAKTATAIANTPISVNFF